MIRFACASCQKTLSAPDDKAGMRFSCPGCKNPVVVPAAAPAQAIRTTPAPQAPAARPPMTAEAPASPPSPIWKRIPAECLAIVIATFRQSLKPFTLLFEVQRRNRYRKKSDNAQFALGQRMVEAQLGDKKLRERIKALGERIVSIQDVRGDAKSAVTERKGLINQLAGPMLAASSAPEDIAGEHERARTIQQKLQSQEESLKGAMGGFMPPNGVAWRRVAIGYSMLLLLALGSWQIYALGGEGRRLARERDAEQNALKVAAENKRAEEDAEWAKDKNSEQIFDKCGTSVALILFKVGKREGGGTGFMIRPGVIATNAHVVESIPPDDLKVYFPSAKEELSKKAFPAKVLHFDAKRDLAFLAVEPVVPPLRMADNFEFKPGKNITIIGCPADGSGKMLRNAVSTGVLSTKTDVRNMPFYQLGASVNGGNSGGPVFDNRGQVIGVVTLKAVSKESISYCIPWQDLKDRLDALEKDDPHKTAAVGQAMHSLNVVVERLFVSTAVYSRVVSEYTNSMRAAAARGRPPEEGINLARPVIDAVMRRVSEMLLDSKHHVLATKLLNDPNLPEDVRKHYNDLWRTYEEFKGMAEKPGGPLNTYASKSQELDNRFKTQITALAESLGFEQKKPGDDDD
ncbi:MAG: serine protease [Gemmataceae bacterium]|nr:serine protease [Gemmataceae bacterium]